MIFVATEFTPEGPKSVNFESKSWDQAEYHCARTGLMLEGILTAIVHDEDTANRMIFELESQKLQKRPITFQ